MYEFFKNIKSISKFHQNITKFIQLLIVMCLFCTQAYAQTLLTGFPDADSDSGRMINVTRGLNTLGDTDDEVLNVSVRVGGLEPTVSIEIFDGDSRTIYGDTTQGFWDIYLPENNTVTPDNVIFELYPDPDLEGNTAGAPLVVMDGSTMADDDWTVFADIANVNAARIDGDPTGDFAYHLVARWETELIVDMQNAFKVRSNGLVFTLAGSTVGFQGYISAENINDDQIPFPLNYDGNFSFAVELRGQTGAVNCVLDIYDGDFDLNGDTNDPNTPDDGISNGGFYPFNPSSVAQDESAIDGIPLDDTPVDVLRISPSVQYSVTGPTGLIVPQLPVYNVVNTDPSGNREFELFRIASSAPGCPDPTDPNYDPDPLSNGIDPPQAQPDVIVPGLGSGFHIVSITGLDYNNNAFINAIGDVVSVDSLRDFSDAPVSYNEGVEAPSHKVIGNLFLGSQIDQELSPIPTVNADGDDTLATDDEDGATLPATLSTDMAGQNYVVTVSVTNGLLDDALQPISANLVGWVDFDGNGVFDADEGVFLNVPSNGVITDYDLIFVVPADVQAGNTYARFRLSTDPLLTTAVATGEFPDGEVEDYALTIESSECIPCKGMTEVTLKLTHPSSYRDQNEIVRVRVGDLLGQFGGSDFSAPILFESTPGDPVLNGESITILIPTEHLGKTLTVSVEGNNHPIEYGKTKLTPDCDLVLGSTTYSTNSYIKFTVTGFEKNSEEICECVECTNGYTEIVLKLTNDSHNRQDSAERVRVYQGTGSGTNINKDGPALFDSLVDDPAGVTNGDLITISGIDPTGNGLIITVQGPNHYYEYIKAYVSINCDLKVGSYSSGNTWVVFRVEDVGFGDGIEICPPIGGEGCTPGYWKQPHHFDSWVDYQPGDIFRDVFGKGSRKSLLYRLSAGGGGYTAYHRHIVAALLNASSPNVDYFLDVNGVIDSYNQTRQAVIAAPSSQRKAIWIAAKNIIRQQNELGCPLN